MARLHEVAVPDVGDKGGLSVAEVHVKAGDAVWADDALLTVESGKAALDVPAPVDGTIKEVRVAQGEAVAIGRVVVVMEEALEQRPKSQPLRGGAHPSAPPRFSLFAAFAASQARQAEDIDCELLVLGGGPGGYSAAFRAADLGLKTVLVERHPVLGGVCLNVGCIPSKALLHLTAAMEEATGLAGAGIRFGRPEIDLATLRAHKAKVVGKLTGGLAAMAKARKVRLVSGTGRFRDAHSVEVELPDNAGSQTIRFGKCIVAAGSHPIHLPFLPRDARIVDSSGALELPFLPARLLVVGGGIVGLEMATVYSALGARVDVVEMQDHLMPGPDRELARIWEAQNRRRFDSVMLRTRTVAAHADAQGVWMRFEGDMAPAEAQRYDMVLQSVGRKPNGPRIGAERAGLAVNEAGFIPVSSRMQTNLPHIYAVGDITGMPMLAHKAVHQAHVAAEAAAGLDSRHDDSLIPGVAYTHPEVAWVGLSEDEAKRKGLAVEVARFPWAASGRAIANGAEYGLTKLVFERGGGRLLGGAIVGSSAGDMIGEIALAVSRGCDAAAIGKGIHHPHPTLGETVGLAAIVAHGSCTDLPPPRKSQSL